MAWDEWEGIKADVAARVSTQPQTQLQLNQHPADQGGGAPAGASENLKSDKKVWVKAGEGVRGLKDGIAKALTKLDDGQAGWVAPKGAGARRRRRSLRLLEEVRR
ncbi:hypothetical protein NKH18_28540 [Streptomyces sp. M10(2022)]